MTRYIKILSAVFLLGLGHFSIAQEADNYIADAFRFQDASSEINSQQYLEAFGVRHSGESGLPQISSEDLRVPLNGTDIVISRTHRPDKLDPNYGTTLSKGLDFWDWSLDVPKIRAVIKPIIGVDSTSYLNSCINNIRTTYVDFPSAGHFDPVGKPSSESYPSGALLRFSNNWIIGCEPFTSRASVVDTDGSAINADANSNAVFLKSPEGTTYYFSRHARSYIRNNIYQIPNVGLDNEDPLWMLSQPQLYVLSVTDIIDKFGNWQAYDYKKAYYSNTEFMSTNDNTLLTKIRSSEGPEVSINRDSGSIDSIEYGDRKIEYNYNGGLESVLMDDDHDLMWDYTLSTEQLVFNGKTYDRKVLSGIANPYGASLSISYQATPNYCETNNYSNNPYAVYRKTVSSYDVSLSSGYVGSVSYSNPSAPGNNGYFETTATFPNKITKSKYWVKSCGFNVKVMHKVRDEIMDSNGNSIRVADYEWEYLDLPSVNTNNTYAEDYNVNSGLPVVKKQTIDGRFVTEVETFDPLGNPLIVLEKDLLNGYFKRTKKTYYNRTNTWLIGHELTSSIAIDSSSYVQVSNNSFHEDTLDGQYKDLAVPYESSSNTDWVSRVVSYHSYGLPKKIELNKKLVLGDGTISSNNRYVQHDNYKYGVSTLVTTSARYNETSDNSQSKELDVFGNTTKVTDARGTIRLFKYDDIGRLTAKRISNDEQTWLGTLYEYDAKPDAYPNSGYVQSINNCSLNTQMTACVSDTQVKLQVDKYDSFLRNQATHIYSYNPDIFKFRTNEYDFHGNVTFSSYWGTGAGNPNGKTFKYDELNRLVEEKDYANTPRFYTHTNDSLTITDPRDNVHSTNYRNYGSPNNEKTMSISSGGALTQITYDAFDNIKSVIQSGNTNGYSVSQTQNHVYDSNGRLCKTARPDTGTTVYSHNAIGEVSYAADIGVVPFVDSCSATVSESQKIRYNYDNQGEVHKTLFTDGITSNQETKFDEVGNLIETVAGDVVKHFEYYGNGLLKSETLTVGTRRLAPSSSTNSLRYFYDANQSLSKIQYPDGDTVRYSPDGFGQPSEVIRESSTSRPEYIYAKDIAYHPNGSIKAFLYGNGISHETALNDNSVPERLTDSSLELTALDYGYTYDGNFNTKSITDYVNPTFSISNISYDGLDRVTHVDGNPGIGESTITYDALSNIRTYSNKNNSLTYTYDTSTLRVSSIADSLSSSNRYSSILYDSRGNIYHNGENTFTFNALNQIVSGDSYAYKYDTSGKRVLQDDENGINYSVYADNGQLLHAEDSDGVTNYIYLGDKLIAKDGFVREFQPKQHYTAFGGSIEGEIDDIGYTGHKFDSSIGLVYAQARYYDPVIGRFYSNDPVGWTPSNPVMSFNRYLYVNNNPYKYTDPDGEFLDTVLDIGFVFYDVGAIVYDEIANDGANRTENLVALGLDAGAIFIPFATGLGTASRVADTAQVVLKAGDEVADVAKRLPDDALVVRGGANITPESIVKGTGNHPSGVTGFSAQCNGGSCLTELGANVRHNQMGVTTVGQVRKAGGDVLVTSGKGNHVTVTNLKSDDASSLLSPSVPNPVPQSQRNF